MKTNKKRGSYMAKRLHGRELYTNRRIIHKQKREHTRREIHMERGHIIEKGII